MPADILNPVRYREDFLKEHADATKAYLSDLIEKTNTSLTENQQDCREINHLDKVLAKTKRKFGLFKVGFGILLTFLVILLLASIGSAYYVFAEQDLPLSPAAKYSVFASLIVVALAFVAFIVYISIFISKKSKKFKATIANFEEIIDTKIQETFAKLQDFYSNFNYSQVFSQMQVQIPEIEFLKSADSNFIAYIEKNFDPLYMPSKTTSPIAYKAGYFYKNPFIVAMYKDMKMVPHTYTGSLVISYEVGYGEHSRIVSETLHATLVKPKPEYQYFALNSLYAQAVPELEFTKDSLSNYNPAKHDKYIKQAEKTLAKIEKTNSNFTPMSNAEFEALFPATNRSSEQKYRAFFGQVAQQNLVKFAKTLSTGREYTYAKVHNTNEVITPDLTDWFSVNPLDLVGYNLSEFLEKYQKYAKLLSASLYDSFIPYLSNPVLLESNVSLQPKYTGEVSKLEKLVLLAKLDEAIMLPDEAGIDEYIVELLPEYENVCRVHSFKTEPRLDYVVVMGGDGPHQVPVHWTEYIPVFDERTFEVSKNPDDSNYFKNNLFESSQAFTEENSVSIVK